MALSGEDLLRLNVMMAQEVQAVRIDENRMQVYGLIPESEVRVDLNPNCRSEQYLKLVREFLSGHVFGSPGGYPVFISRWTRMGQAKDENLQKLLMLGEPEAVVSVVHAKGLSPEVAQYAWWCMPESENGRRMLEKSAIVESELGPILAEHLYEHLAFETDPKPMIDSVRLMLQPGLISEEKKQKLWRSSQRKNAYLVGFLQAMPDQLPHAEAARHDYEKMVGSFDSGNIANNPYVEQLSWWLGAAGQRYLETVTAVLKKPANQDVVVYLLNTINEKLAASLPIQFDAFPNNIPQVDELVEQLFKPGSELYQMTDASWQELVNTESTIQTDLKSILWLAQIREEIVTSIFAQTTAEGTLMRKKLEPVTGPIFEKIQSLQGIG